MTRQSESPALVLVIDMASAKPYVQAACLCEKVIVERDNVASVIRMVDRYRLHVPEGAPPKAKTVIKITVFVSIKSVGISGEHKLGLKLHYPDGTEMPAPDATVTFAPERGGHHQTYNADLEVALDCLGEHYFDVLWDGEFLTRIPFTIVATPSEPHSTSP